MAITHDPILGKERKKDISSGGSGGSFAPLNGTPTQVRYFNNAGVDYSDPLFTRDSATNHTQATRDYDSTSTINTVTVPVQFLTKNTNGTFNVGDLVETRYGEAQGEVLDTGTFVINDYGYTGLAYSGVGLNDLTSIYVGGYTGVIFPVTYSMEILQNNVAYSGIGGVSGTLSIGDTITGLSSGATAVIVAIDTFKNILAVDTIVGTFIPSETVEGNTPSDFASIGGDFSSLADIALYSNSNANSIITTIAPTSQLEGVDISFSAFTGHTIGDIRSFQVNATSTNTIVYLTNVTGTLPLGVYTRLNNLTTPFQTDDGEIAAGDFTVGDTVDVIDFTGGFTQVGQISITGRTGQDFTYSLNSGTIATGNYLYGSGVDKTGFIYNLTSNNVTTTIRTGFETQEVVFPVIPFPLQGSALTSDNGSDKAGIGVFDFTPFGQEDAAVPAIIKFYADGSQGTFQVTKEACFLNGYDAATNSSFDVILGAGSFDLQLYDGTNQARLALNHTDLRYTTNGNNFILPTTYGGANTVVCDLLGDGTLSLNPISSLITVDNIYTVNGTLNGDRKVTGLSYDMVFIGTNSLWNEQYHFGNINDYDSTGITTTGFSHGSLGLIKAQSVGFEDSQYVYTLYTGVGDFTGSLPNKARTLYIHDGNTEVSTVNTRLVESTSSNSVYDETITANGTNIIGTKTNTVATNSSQINESYDVLTGEFIRTISNIFDSNTYQQTRTSFGYTAYDNSRDDSGVTTPINFIYTDNGGTFLSAPLADPYQIIIDMKTANYTVVAADQGHIIHIDNSGGSIDITFPDPATVKVGRPFKFKAVGNSANTVRFLPFGSENINLSSGAYTWSNPLGLQYLEVYSDGIERFIS